MQTICTLLARGIWTLARLWRTRGEIYVSAGWLTAANTRETPDA